MSAIPRPQEPVGRPQTTQLPPEVDRAWRQFSSAASAEEFCESWLALQCHFISGVNDGVVILQKPGTENFAPFAFWPEDRGDRSHLVAVTEHALREGRGIVQPRPSEGGTPSGLSDYQLAYPIRLGGRVHGVVGLDIAPRPEAQVQAAVRQLQWGAGWLEVLLRRHADPLEAARLRLKIILDVVSVFLDRIESKEAATAVVTEIAAQLGCDRVSLGVRRSGAIRIEAVSHAVQFDRHANQLRQTEAAMTEALDQKEPVVFPPIPDRPPVVTMSHAELAQLTGAGGVATFPLVNGERLVVGALTVERAPGLALDLPAVELLEALASMLGPLVEIQRVRHRGLPGHALDSAAGCWGRLAGPSHPGFKLAAVCIVVLLALLLIVTGDYRITADTKVEGLVQRAIPAPFNGFVRETSRRAGDTVRKGEFLARLDDRDLRLEQSRLAAQRDQLAKQYREAMANRDRAQTGIVSAQIDQIEAQLALVQEQLSRTELLAPFDGILVSGDLTQALGAPLERGQVLFEIAPLDSYRVILQVDEHLIADLKVGQKGELVVASMPGRRLPVSVKLITPVSTQKEGRNFFRVEAQLDGQQEAHLRPGMEGIAKIHVGERRLAWIWTRELVHWTRLKLWAWLP